MTHTRPIKRTFPWKQIAITVLLVAALGLAGFVLAANTAFYRSLPAELPCRHCSGESRSVHINGFDLYYRELGPGDLRLPVVILHGGPGHSSQSFMNSFDFLSGEYRVVYYDQRGSGNSQIKPDNAAYTIDQLVEELEAIRRDVLSSDQFVVVGHSAGGALAQRYALKYREHVASMVLVSSIPINNGVATPAVWDRLLPAMVALNGWPPTGPLARDEWFAQLNKANQIDRLHNTDCADLLHNAGYLSFATWREVSRSLSGDDYRYALEQLQVPTLVVYGASDSDTTGEWTANRLCETLPNCTLTRFDQSGHWPFLEEPENFAQVVTDFLTERAGQVAN